MNGDGFGFYPRFRAVPVGCLQSPHGLVAGDGAKVLPDSTMTKLLSEANGGTHPQQVSCCTPTSQSKQ